MRFHLSFNRNLDAAGHWWQEDASEKQPMEHRARPSCGTDPPSPMPTTADAA